MDKFIRAIKNWAFSRRYVAKGIITLANMAVIGDLYDLIYFRHIREEIRKEKFSLTIEPNNLCNLQCIMCPYKRMKREKTTMPLGMFQKIIDEAKELGIREVHLTQYNEPFTDKHLFERLDYLRKKGMRSSFYSNATLMDKKTRGNLLNHPADLIRFSVDGINKGTFESIRKGANFEKVTGNISSLYAERKRAGKDIPRVEVYFTMLEKNCGEAKDFLKFWKKKCDFASVYLADSRESEKFVGEEYKKLKPYPCFNPRRVLVLSNGKVALCCVDVDGNIPLGDLNKESLKKILYSKRFKGIFESQMKRECAIEMCKNCSKLYIDSAFSWWGEK